MRDLDKDPIVDPNKMDPTGEEEETLLDKILINVTWLHLIFGGVAIFIFGCLFVVSMMLIAPKYGTYLEYEEMKQAVMWAETHAKISHILPPGTNLNEYILYTNLEETDVESLEHCGKE